MLTCHLAYLEALKYAEGNITLTKLWAEHLAQFTPTITVDSNWSCIFMNAMFCEAMYRQNPIKAVGLMDEAGVSFDAIKDLAHQFKALPQVDTYKPIAPPTFLDTPIKWQKRGYEVTCFEATEGDLVLTEQFIGWLRGAEGLALRVLHANEGNIVEAKVPLTEVVSILRV